MVNCIDGFISKRVNNERYCVYCIACMVSVCFGSINMCDCVNWDFVIESIGVIVFSNILMYKLGCMQGEKTAYKRFTKVCNVCRNKNK